MQGKGRVLVIGFVGNRQTIGAGTVVSFLKQLKCHYGGVPLKIVLDNARYQKCKIVIALASELNIELLFLPAYSPNLNLIERLWKFVKKKVLYSRYYSDFGSFTCAISDCLNQTNTTYKTEFDSLPTVPRGLPECGRGEVGMWCMWA